LKLSNEAIKTLRIKTAKFSGGQIPQSAFVTDRDRKGFYLFRESYFKYFDESHLKNLNSDDHVAVSGVDVLRITEVYINDNSEYGHGH
jgi:hypothetical protein